MADPLAPVAALMHAFLDAVSFAPGAQPDYPALRGLFGPGAQLIKAIGDTAEVATVDAFIAPRQADVDAGVLTSFDEREVRHVTEAFGNVAHRFSTYEKRGVLRGAAFAATGLISTQFVRLPEGWRISAMAWDDERPGLSIPERYRAAEAPAG